MKVAKMNSVDHVVAKFGGFVIEKLDLDDCFVKIKSTETKQTYAHKWAEIENPNTAVGEWMKRFVLGREEFHRKRIQSEKKQKTEKVSG